MRAGAARQRAATLLVALLAAAPRVARGGVWGLTDVYEDELLEYYSKFTGNLTGEPPADGEQPAFLPGAALLFERAGLTEDTSWPNVLRGVTSAGAAIPADETVLSGVGFATSVPNPATSSAAPYPDARRACGPSTDASFDRDAGCTPDLQAGSPYGSAGDPGFGPAQWAYTGASMGPPGAPTGDELGLCSYSLSVETDAARQLECRKAPARGGVPWPQPYADALAAARFSAAGAPLPRGAYADRLPPVFQASYATVPLRWGFEEGTLAPYWSLLTEGLPTLAVTRRCLLEAHSGQFQLCSAYPWPRRNATHGLLHVRSVPFVLGAGDLTWQMNGGDASVQQLPRGTLDMAINGEGALGVALSRASDGYRVLGQPARAERFWALQRWPAATLAPHVGEKFVIDVFDYRCCSWGWLAVDSFVIPAAWVQITSLSPSGGAIGGRTQLTVVGKNFGSSPEGLVVFIGDLECGNLQMPSRGTLRCITPACDWCMNGSVPIPLAARSGLTVSVVVGDRTRALERGAKGGHQAGHCGAESTAYPFSRCSVVDASLPAAFGTPARGFTFRAAPKWAPSTVAAVASVLARTAVQDREFEFSPRAMHPDLDESELVYSSGPLPGWLAFEPGAPALTGTPLVSDAVCPYGADCSQGVPYALTFTATDGIVRITLAVTVLVTGPETAASGASAAAEAELLPAAEDGSYSWASEDEWSALRARARNAGYALRLASALLAQEQAAASAAAADKALADGSLTENQALDAAVASGARGPVQKALATLMARAAEGDGAVDAALTMAMAQRAGAGAAAATGTAAARLRLALRTQQDAAAAAALAALPLSAGTYSGAYSGAFSGSFNGTLSGTVSGSFTGGGVFGGIGGYTPPPANSSANVSGTFVTYAAANGTYNGSFSGNLSGTFSGDLLGDMRGSFSGSFAAAAAGAYGGWFFSLSRVLEAGGAPVGSALQAAAPDGAGPAVAPATWPAFGAAPAPTQPFLAAAPAGDGDDFEPQRVVVPPGGQLASVPVPTPCAENDAELPSCVTGNFTLTYTLWLALPPGGLAPTDAALEPADFPHADLLASGLAAGDVAALAAALATRAAAYARRRQEVKALDKRYAAVWAPASALLTLQLLQPLPPPAPPLVATLDLAHAYPAAPPGAPAAALWEGATTVRVLRLDGVAFHAEEAAEAITAELALMSSGASLTERVAALEVAAGLAAGRCANDCSRRGTCDFGATSYPPRCLCAAGATGSDCSAATCPAGCSGNGACDSLRVCVRNDELGTVTCSGGSGRCACYSPWTGTECAQRACGSAYTTLEGLNTTNLTPDAVYANFSARGYTVDRVWDAAARAWSPLVWVAAWDGVPRVRGAIAGDEYSRAGPTTGVAVVRFTSAAEAARARDEQERAMPRIPARGVAAAAPQFMTQYRAAVERERYLLRLFNLPTADCSGRGTCDTATGACTCDTSGAVGAACELRTCPAGCSGHGACDAGTGECACDAHYAPHPLLGCELAPLGLASTICEDAALDDRQFLNGTRMAPLQLSCMLGVPLGAAAAAGYCPAHASSDAEYAATGSATATTCYTALEDGSGPLCADCSGFAPLNVSQLHLYPDEGCKQRPPELRQPGTCLSDRRPSDVVSGLGAPPPTGVSFSLTALRSAGVRFSTFTARAGVVRRYASCGDCGAAGGYCGAAFTVLLDGVVAYDAVVATSQPVTLDVRAASTLTLRTRSARGPHWRLGDAPYSGTGAPGLASQPVAAPWCDGAAWADAKLS